MKLRPLAMGGLLSMVVAAGCGDRVSATIDGGADATAPRDAVVDAARAPSACEMAGGMCIPAARSSSPPGFTFTCPSGLVSPNGTPTWLGPGSDLLFSDCPAGSGFEPQLSGCCKPARDQ